MEWNVSRRGFLGAAAVAMAGTHLPPLGAAPNAVDPVVRRGNWAGIELVAGDRTLFLDPLDDIASLGAGAQFAPVATSCATQRCDVAITHVHNDHYDRALLRRLWADPASRGRVIVPEPLAAYVASDGFRVSPVGNGVPLTMGPFVVSAVPAHDGWGEWQVSYVIDVGGRRFFHGGDTLWHGKWWDYGRLFGPFDVAFLPINGAIIPPRTGDARIPHTLTAEQAVIAAKALQAHTLVPMHYGVHDPGRYEQEPDLLSRAATLAVRAGIGFHAAVGGALVPLPTPASR